LVAVGGLEGTIRGKDPTGLSPLAGREVQLLDGNGTIVARGTVEWDGGFALESVPPGRYNLTVDPDALRENKVVLVPGFKEVVMPGGLDPVWLTRMDFRLERAP
jgi:hypothetical protein